VNLVANSAAAPSRYSRLVLDLFACREKQTLVRTTPNGSVAFDPNATSASYSTSLSSCAKSLSWASGNAVRRREFITLIGAATAWPVAARGQKARKLPTIGFSGRNGAVETPFDRERVR
jgi:hypothetical protein